jgi:hypothetical protein
LPLKSLSRTHERLCGVSVIVSSDGCVDDPLHDPLARKTQRHCNAQVLVGERKELRVRHGLELFARHLEEDEWPFCVGAHSKGRPRIVQDRPSGLRRRPD